MENKDKNDQENLQEGQENTVLTEEQEVSGPDSQEKSQGDPAGEAEELRIQLAEQKDKFLRLFAEFDNYKKRTMRERLELIKTASQDTMAALLPVLDDFDRAKRNAETEGSTEVFSEGIQLVYNKLYSVLKQKGLEAMESTGQDFDPEFHEALSEIPAPDEASKGKVIDTVEKGYFLHDKIIRHAKVVVGK